MKKQIDENKDRDNPQGFSASSLGIITSGEGTIWPLYSNVITEYLSILTAKHLLSTCCVPEPVMSTPAL
jgi:hypothetical protein